MRPKPLQRLSALRLLLLAALISCLVAVSAWGSGQEALKDPVALGAWLYQGNCLGCHEDYGTERLASDYDDEEELTGAISQGGCKVDWARRYGGKLKANEIKGLARFMLKWEELDQQPDLPELPPQPTENQDFTSKKKKSGYVLPEEKMEVIHPALSALMQSNPVAHGAWLYIKNCYRCHLDYTKARMGQGVSPETVNNTITFGKTSTQMLPFSSLLGGELSRGQIEHITTYIATWERYREPLAISPRLLKPPSAGPEALKPIPMPRFARVSGDAVAGMRLYRLNCLGCHAEAGGGYIGPALAKTWGSLRPDLTIKSVIKQGVPASLMKSWDQSAGGPLAAKDVADLTALLQSWAPNIK